MLERDQKRTPQKQARDRLTEALSQGASTFNQAVPIGSDQLREPTDVYRSYWESLVAAKDVAFETLPTSNAFNKYWRGVENEEGKEQGRKKYTPEEANEKYSWMPKPFTSPVDPIVAQHMADRQLRLIELQGVIDSANQGRLASGSRMALQFGIGMFDPFNAAAGFGIGRMIGLAGSAISARAAATAGTAGRRATPFMFDAGATGGRAVMRDFAQMSAGNLAIEPINAGLAGQAGDVYDDWDTFNSVVAFPGGMAGLMGAGRWAHPRLKRLMGTAPKADAIAGQSAAINMAAGKNIDAGRVVRDVMQERMPTTSALLGDGYEHVPVKQPRDLQERDFYHASDVTNQSVKNTIGHPIERDMGPGVYLTDRPSVAEGYASSKYSPDGSGVLQVRTNKADLNVIDLDKGLPDKAKTVVEALWNKWRPSDLVRELAEADGKLRDTLPPPVDEFAQKFKGQMGGHVLDMISEASHEGMIPQDAMTQLANALEAVGFDGYHFNGGSSLGHTGAPHTGMMLFDGAGTGDAGGKLSTVKRYVPTKSLGPEPTAADIQRRIDELNSIKSDALYEKADHEKITKHIDEPLQDLKRSEVEAKGKVVDEEVKSAFDRGELGAEHQKMLDELQEQLRDGEEEDQILKATLFCLNRST